MSVSKDVVTMHYLIIPQILVLVGRPACDNALANV